MPGNVVITLKNLLTTEDATLLGGLASLQAVRGFDSGSQQVHAWEQQLGLLRQAGADLLALADAHEWTLVLEYNIPLRQKRPDVVLLARDLIFVIEFKIGATSFDLAGVRQVETYCLDLRDFHACSDERTVVPVLVASAAEQSLPLGATSAEAVQPVLQVSGADLGRAIAHTFTALTDTTVDAIDARSWVHSPYRPVPGILQAAEALYAGHRLRDIALASADDLDRTTAALLEMVDGARRSGGKLICFVTGVPGAGKTLAGLNLVHEPSLSRSAGGIASFLSGNGPLVRIMREALARDQRVREGLAIGEARRRVATFIWNVHDFMRTYVQDKPDEIPHQRIIVFDEAQRAWSADYAARKFGRSASEPVEALSVMNRHDGWAAVVALVGGGQEIHTGEAGLSEWGRAIAEHFPHWQVAVAPQLLRGDCALGGSTLFPEGLPDNLDVVTDARLHLNVSVRSWRAETLTQWVNAVLEMDPESAARIHAAVSDFPVAMTRSLDRAREWLALRARGDRRCGLIASSGGLRLRAYGLETSSGFTRGYPFEEWWLGCESDVRSSYQLEVPATEFECQGLELDWVGLCWANDLVPSASGRAWLSRRFVGAKWQELRASEAKAYLVNKYRVLLTRAREGLIIWVPEGRLDDPTLSPVHFDAVADYLRQCGLATID